MSPPEVGRRSGTVLAASPRGRSMSTIFEGRVTLPHAARPHGGDDDGQDTANRLIGRVCGELRARPRSGRDHVQGMESTFVRKASYDGRGDDRGAAAER